MFKLQRMCEKAKDRSFPELIVDIKNATDLFRTAGNQFPSASEGFRCGLYLLLFLAMANLMCFQFQ